MDRLSRLSTLARELISKRVKASGGKPESSMDVVRFGIGELAARCHVSNVDRGADGFVSRVELELALRTDAKEGIRECSVGIAGSEDTAVTRAVDAWFEGVLPPVRAALGLGSDDRLQPFKLSQTDPTGRNGRRWRVFGGSIQVAGDDREALIHCLDAYPPFAYLAQQGGLPLFPESDGIFWMRITCSHRNGADPEGECRVNNIAWPMGLQVLSGLPWPPTGGSILFRQFLAGRPTGRRIRRVGRGSA